MSSDTAPTAPISRAEEQIARTEKEIFCTEEESCRQLVFLFDLRAKRNSFLPVFRLPPETLATIFIHGARNYYESGNGHHFALHIPTWVNVSYVCSHWRNIALNCPTLWTYHFTASLRWSEELLLRSKQASLKISCVYPSPQVPWWSDFLDNLLKHLDHIRDLRFDIPLSSFPTKFSLSAPRLENLEIRLRMDVPKQSIAITDGDKPPLRTLKLVNCSLPWYSLNLSGLKTLSLHYADAPSLPNMVEFLAILSNMRNLTHLDLRDALPSARGFLSSGGLNGSPKIDLPCLALLAVSAPLSTVVALLSCVNIPLRTQLSLELLSEFETSTSEYTPISSFLAQQFSEQLSGPTFHSLFLDARNFSLIFTCDCDPPSPNAEVDHNIPLKIFIEEIEDEDMEEVDSNTICIISDIFCSLPLTHIQSLHIMWPQFLSGFLKKMLGCVDGLRYMELSHGCMPDLSLLSLVTPESNENPGGQPIPDQDLTSRHMFVPALEELQLYGILFPPDHVSLQGSMSEESLIDTLSTRKWGRHRLIMDHCGLQTPSLYGP